jgi:hypothetical protein
MAQLRIETTDIVVTFARWERLFTRRAELKVPLAQVKGVTYVRQPVSTVRGLRSGLLVTGLLKVGVWFGIPPGRRLVSVRRGVPAVRLELTDHNHYAAVIVSTPKAAELAVEIRPGARQP